MDLFFSVLEFEENLFCVLSGSPSYPLLSNNGEDFWRQPQILFCVRAWAYTSDPAAPQSGPGIHEALL